MLDQKNLAKISDILLSLTYPEKPSPETTQITQSGAWSRWLLRVYLASVVAFIAVACIYRYWVAQPASPHAPTPVVDFFYVMMQILAMAYPTSIICELIPHLWRSRKKPYATLMADFRKSLHEDVTPIAALLEFDQSTLRYALVQYRHHMNIPEGRIACLAGDLRKIGLLPALAAAIVSGASLYKSTSNLFLWAPLILTCTFYLFAFTMHDLRERVDKVLALLEYAIEHAPETENKEDPPKLKLVN